LIQETDEETWVTMLTVPETLAPLAGEVIFTAPVGVGVADGVAVGVGVAMRVGVAVGVGVGIPLAIVTVTASLPTCAPLLLKARVEIVCEPFATVVEFQLKVNGGEDAK
jgi:hypothetical protein